MKKEQLLREYRSVQTITINALVKEIKEIEALILSKKHTELEKALGMRKEDLRKTLVVIKNDRW